MPLGQIETSSATMSRSSSTNSAMQQPNDLFKSNPLHVDQDGRSFALLTSYNDTMPTQSTSSSTFMSYEMPIQVL